MVAQICLDIKLIAQLNLNINHFENNRWRLLLGKPTKNQHLREKMRTAAKQSKQTALGSLPDVPQKKSAKAAASEQSR